MSPPPASAGARAGAFSDRFGALAAGYAAHRPAYPRALFSFLAAESPGRARAWDCATGSGQAAVALAEHFDAVDATDASADQLAHARPHPRVSYRVAPAEASGLPEASVDAVTVAQALHWFDRPAFFAEAGRVLRPGGLLAVWTYGHLAVKPEVDRVVHAFYQDVLGAYWDEARRHVEDGYAGFDFPFEPLAAPPFTMEAAWTLGTLVGYLGTWSALRAYREATGADPLPDVAGALAAAWGEPAASRPVRWPLALHVRRKPR